MNNPIESARAIVRHGENTTYPSGAAASHIRMAMQHVLLFIDWQPGETAPKDGTHILVCEGPYSEHWGFNQRPPLVVHYFNDPDAPGFYQSQGIVQDSYNDCPIAFTNWRPLGPPPSFPEGDSA